MYMWRKTPNLPSIWPAIFIDGEKLTYTCTSSDEAVAKVTVNGTLMKVTGVKTGSAHITVKVSNGSGTDHHRYRSQES